MPSPSTSTQPGEPPRITLEHRAVRVVDAVAFGKESAEAPIRFLTRVFSLPEVESVTLDFAARSATIAGPARPETLLPALARALRGETRPLAVAALPPIQGGERFTIRRHRGILTRCEIFVDAPGLLRFRIDGLKGNAAIADRLIRRLEGKAKLASIPPCTWTGVATIRFDPSLHEASTLIRLADEALLSPAELKGTELAKPVRFGPANTSMALATLTELALPALGSVCALFLVVLNLDNFRDAYRQIKARRLGLPVLYSAIVGATLAAGQFLPSALMTWLFCYWKRRYRMQLAVGRERLLSEHLPAARLARRDAADDVEVFVTPERLKPGDRLLVRADESIPADGRIVDGEAVVDERVVSGLSGVSRKRVGDPVLAGSLLLFGEIRVEVERVGDATTVSALRRALIRATDHAPGRTAPTEHSEEFASKAVGPTLAAAGLGLLTGDVAAVSAILRPDYATGPGIAVPLEALRDVADCARLGIALRRPDALSRLNHIDLVVIEDQDEFWRGELEVAQVHSRLPEDLVLKLAAGAFRHFHDPRASALLDRAKARGLTLPRIEPSDFSRGVTIVYQGNHIRVSERDSQAGIMGPLVVDVDGVTVALIEFQGSNRSRASAVLNRLRPLVGVPIVFVSKRPPDVAAKLAGMLGIEVAAGGLTDAGIEALLLDCKNRGLRVAHVAPAPSDHAHVSISLGGAGDWESDRASISIRNPDLARLEPLWTTAREHVDRVKESHRFILFPNLFCVAGAFLFGFTGLTSVLISNIGTYGLFRRSRESLDALVPPSKREPQS